MSFTATEEEKILHHLRYPNWESLAQSISLGYPSSTQPLFLVRDSFRRIALEGQTRVRQCLCECDSIEAQLSSARSRMRVQKVGEIAMNPQEAGMLRTEYVYWQRALADALGVVPNPYSQTEYLGMGGGGLNAKVSG